MFDFRYLFIFQTLYKRNNSSKIIWTLYFKMGLYQSNVYNLTHEYCITTVLLHYHIIIWSTKQSWDWTKPIFKLGLHFNLNYTPVKFYDGLWNYDSDNNSPDRQRFIKTYLSSINCLCGSSCYTKDQILHVHIKYKQYKDTRCVKNSNALVKMCHELLLHCNQNTKDTI